MNDPFRESADRSLGDIPADSLRGTTVLLTGASGVIGTHLLFGLERLGAQVTAVARHGPTVHLDNVNWLTGDLGNIGFLQSLPPADIVIHAAGYGQPSLFTKNPLETLWINVPVTNHLLAKVTPGGKLMFFSSSEVYSGLSNPPFSEDQIGTTRPDHPRACYIEGKRCGETICNYARSLGVDAKSVRLSLAYGPGFRLGDTRVLYSLIEHGLRDKEISLLDSGAVRRTYCYVADAIYMVWRILLKGRHPLYNVGGISRTTIRGLAETVGSLMALPVRVPPDGVGLSDAPEDVWLDITRFTDEFGPVNFVPLEQGLGYTIAWARSLWAQKPQSL